MQTPKLDGSSQQMSLAIGVSTPIINNNNSNMSQNLKNSNSGMVNSITKSLVNPHELTAPHFDMHDLRLKQPQSLEFLFGV